MVTGEQRRVVAVLLRRGQTLPPDQQEAARVVVDHSARQRWIALAYAVTLVGHPAVSLPVGLDRNGMPFGLQIVGPRGGDAYVLGVAAALEAMLAGDKRTARPVPDIAKLKVTAPISAMAGFMGFG